MAFINNQSREKVDNHKKIIDFIRLHKFCNKQRVVEGLQNEISRVTVFKLLHELTDSGAVKEYSKNNQKINARDHKLYVEEDNPLISVRLELEEFEKTYFHLLDRAMTEFSLKYQTLIEPTNGLVDSDKALDETLEVAMGVTKMSVRLLDIFYSMVDAYLFRFLFEWSHTISDQHVLQQLYSIVFSKIIEMQTRLSEKFKYYHTIIGDWKASMDPFILERFRGSKGSRKLVQYLDTFNEFGMEEEIEKVIDSLWKIFGDLKLNIYPEPQKYGWSFKYGEDHWEKLVSLLKGHPKAVPFGWNLGPQVLEWESNTPEKAGKIKRVFKSRRLPNASKNSEG